MNLQEAKKIDQQICTTFKNFIPTDSTIITGISGGPDSVFLLHQLAKYTDKIIVAHLNHNLRKEADQEQKFVENLCQNLNLNYISKSLNIKEISKKSKKGLEETGRHERYKLFRTLAKKHKATLITTAHHANDNLETIIQNLTRGASLSGLSGMSTLEENLFRPLLQLTKQQITDYLNLHKIKFVIDQSNYDTKYTRNFIRHEVIPKLEQLNPSLPNTISKNSQNLKEINDYLIQKANEWINKNTLNKSFTQLPAKSFKDQHPALQKQILLNLHYKHIGHTKNLENTHFQEVLSLIFKNVGNKRKKLGKTIFSLQNNVIHIEKS